eukprot:3965923-Pyramimonas_sp.AAC.1
MVSCRLLPRVRQPVVVDAETWPHLPVTMELSATAFDAKVRRLVEPRGFRRPPASGCARFPPDWDPIL